MYIIPVIIICIISVIAKAVDGIGAGCGGFDSSMNNPFGSNDNSYEFYEQQQLADEQARKAASAAPCSPEISSRL